MNADNTNDETRKKPVPAKLISESHLPERFRQDKDLLQLIQCMRELTGLILFPRGERGIRFKVHRRIGFKVRGTWSNVRGTRSKVRGTRSKVRGTRSKMRGTGSKVRGTGFIQRIRFVHGKCPCSDQCLDSQNQFAIVTVSTVVHIFDDKKDRTDLRHEFVGHPGSAEIKFGYASDAVNDEEVDDDNDDDYYDVDDDDELIGLLTLYGYRLVETDKDLGVDSDWCCLEFVCHEVNLIKLLNKTLTDYQELQGKVYQKYKDKPDNLVVVVGHPGGGPMQISIGEKIKEYEVLKEIRDGQRWGRYHYNAPTETGSSGSPVFVLGQPISGFGYWFGHPHNHSAGDAGQNNNSSIGVEYLVV